MLLAFPKSERTRDTFTPPAVDRNEANQHINAASLNGRFPSCCQDVLQASYICCKRVLTRRTDKTASKTSLGPETTLTFTLKYN